MSSHKHGAVVHTHAHSHVTHYLRPTEDWVHLSTSHGHEHNHSACEHTHEAHQNAEKEHAREGHVHDHRHPAQS